MRPAAVSILLLVSACSAFADDLGRTALAVLEPDAAKLAATLHEGLANASPPVRAAREEARAVVMLGGTAELDRWQFAPGTLDGEPVEVLFELSVRFHSSTSI